MRDTGAINRTTAEITVALERLWDCVPAPVPTRTATGIHYRCVEKSAEQALVLKCVRILSGFHAFRTMIDVGLPLDAGASMRILDELSSDILFIAGPLIHDTEPEPRHSQFLNEFFQDEFDDPDPIKSTQRRHRVGRRDVRAYIARSYKTNFATSDVVAVTETIDAAFSGYIHGAADHILDFYDGRQFRIQQIAGDAQLKAVRGMLSTYSFRALGSYIMTAKALRQEEIFSGLYRLSKEIFDDFGEVRPKHWD